MRQFLGLALTRAGHAVCEFADGREAFAHLQDLAVPCDLLLTDIVMPGMDGIELSYRVRDSRPQIKIMYVTGFGTVAAGDAAGPVLAKPLHLGSLLAEVARVLERQL